MRGAKGNVKDCDVQWWHGGCGKGFRALTDSFAPGPGTTKERVARHDETSFNIGDLLPWDTNAGSVIGLP